jgi:hypothetical protein
MGYAKTAGLNHLPMHVLELADQLALTEEQRVAARTLRRIGACARF